MKKLRIIYAGNPEFAIIPLKTILRKEEFKVISVITSLDKKTGRGQKVTPQPVALFGDLNKLIVHRTDDIKKIEQKLRLENADFMVVFAFGQILPPEALKIPRLGCINIHPSLLPKYRGATPVQETILQGDKETGITFILMNEQMDTGPILYQEKFPVKESNTSENLLNFLSEKAANKLPEILIQVSAGKIIPQEQNHPEATYCRKIKKEHGAIDFRRETAEEIHRKIKAFTRWPSAYFFLDGKRIKILSSTLNYEQKISPAQATVVHEKLMIGTKKGNLVPLKIQPEGKKPLSVEEFLRGYRGSLGSTLSSLSSYFSPLF